MSDALAVGSWLNVFIRTCQSTKIACLAQSVNVISPLTTSPTGLLKQTTWFPLLLFAKYMRGTAIDLKVISPNYSGETDLFWLKSICSEELLWIDSSASLVGFYVSSSAYHPLTHLSLGQDEDMSALNLVIVNRHDTQPFDVQVNLAQTVTGDMEVHEIHHENIMAVNSWKHQPVGIVESTDKFGDGLIKMKAGSMKLLRIPLALAE